MHFEMCILFVLFSNLVFFLQEFLSRCSAPNNGKIHTDIPTEKSSNDDHTVKSRGWLNWLSRGMLGAGGTDDSSQFSGVVSYDVKVHTHICLLNYHIILRVVPLLSISYSCMEWLTGKTAVADGRCWMTIIMML